MFYQQGQVQFLDGQFQRRERKAFYRTLRQGHESLFLNTLLLLTFFLFRRSCRLSGDMPHIRNNLHLDQAIPHSDKRHNNPSEEQNNFLLFPFPIQLTFQSPTYLLEKDHLNISTFNCDITQTECRVNFNLNIDEGLGWKAV